MPDPEPPPATDPPPEPPVDQTMPPLVEVLPPETEFELACTDGSLPGDTGSPPLLEGDTARADNGILIDSLVSGVAYQTGSLRGVTDTEGTYYFNSGELVQFMLGDVLLGEISPLGRVSPFDLAGSGEIVGMEAITAALEDDSHPFHAAINTAVLLQSLDEDGDPDNGIEITPEVAALFNGASLDLSQPWPSFQYEYRLAHALTTANADGLFSVEHGAVNPARALGHLYTTLGIEAHTFGIALEQGDWDGDGTPDDVTRYSYDVDGNLVRRESTIDGGWLHNIESWAYDDNGNLVASNIQEFGQEFSETRRYSPDGELILQEEDQDGNGIPDSEQTWSYRYNPDGSLKKVTVFIDEEHEDEVSETTATFQYNSAGNPARIEMEGSRLHVVAAQLGLPLILHIEYGSSYIITMEYDADGVLSADTLDGSHPERGYHIVNRSFDAHGNLTHYEGRLLTSFDNEEQVIARYYRYEYDAQGNITEQWVAEDENGQADRIIGYEYNADGRVSRELTDWDSDGATDEIAHYSYNQHGALVRTEWDNDADGEIDYIERWPYEYEYDDSGRIVRRTLELNGDGQPEEVIGYSYHSDGTLEQEDLWSRDVFVPEVSTWEYNAIGNLLREQTDYGNDGLADRITNYGYDACGGLNSREVYDEVGLLSSSERWQYDAYGKLRHHEWEGGDFTPLFQDSLLSLNIVGFLSDGLENWQYDAQGRVSRYQFECYGECVVLSGEDELELVALRNQVINMEYDDADRLSRELVDENDDGQADRVIAYEYDDSGRLLRRIVDVDGDGTADTVEEIEDKTPGEDDSGTPVYDDQGKLVRREYYDEHGDILEHLTTYEYDTHGNLLREAASHDFDGDGVMEETESWEYVPTGWGHLLNARYQ